MSKNFRLHAQFSWPYPVIGSQFVHQIEKKLGNIRVSQSTASLNGLVASESTETLKPKARKTEKTVIDLNGAKPGTDHEASEEDVEIQEAVLERIRGSDAELVPMLDRSPSTSSSVHPLSVTPAPATPSSCESRSVTGDWQNTDFLVGEKSSRGNLESSRQIELMLCLFSQTAAIDWIFLLCLISRDERKLRQEINVSMLRRAGEKSFARIRFACSELSRWAVEKCCGYVALLQAFDAHLAVVAQQAGIADLKFNPKENERRRSSELKNEDRGRRRTDSGGAKLNSSFATKQIQNGGRRERSRSADRAHKSVKRYHFPSSVLISITIVTDTMTSSAQKTLSRRPMKTAVPSCNPQINLGFLTQLLLRYLLVFPFRAHLRNFCIMYRILRVITVIQPIF